MGKIPEKNKLVDESVHSLNTAKAAEMLGMSERNVQHLAKEKIIPRAKRGHFDLFATAKAYIQHLKDRLSGKVVNPEEGFLKDRKLLAETKEREAKAALREIELEVERGKLFKREEVIAQWTARLLEFKSAMLLLPKRVASRFTDPDVRLHVEEEVTIYVHEILAAYSREGIIPSAGGSLGDADDAARTETATQDIGKPVGGRKPRAAGKRKSRTRAVEDK